MSVAVQREQYRSGREERRPARHFMANFAPIRFRAMELLTILLKHYRLKPVDSYATESRSAAEAA